MGITLKYPVVLIHGLGAKSRFGPVEYFYSLPERLRNDRNQVLVANLTACEAIDRRAAQLKEQILAAFPDTRVNLIGHSMGGLDARYLASRPEFTERIASVTTIGTPHRGSVIGDIATGLVPNTAFNALNGFLNLLGTSTAGFQHVTTRYCRGEFAQIAPNAKRVAYFSATTAITKVFKHSLPIFWVPTKIVQRVEGDNDGFVSVESATWGEHICTQRGDHYAQIGQILGRARGLDYVAFQNKILKRLRSEGF